MQKDIKRTIREKLISKLWQNFRAQFPFIDKIFDHDIVLDHFAVIDFRTSYSGIEYMKTIFESIGYVYAGSGYLPQKNNHFEWLNEEDSHNKLSRHCLPQVVIADFNLDNLSDDAKNIVQKYATYIEPINDQMLELYKHQLSLNNYNVIDDYVEILYEYFTRKPRFLPTVNEFELLRSENELMAWVTIFGRIVNHFGIAVHHSPKYTNLETFNSIAAEFFELNDKGGLIKGGSHTGIAQSSMIGQRIDITLNDGSITIPNKFLEFIWRYPCIDEPKVWQDYFRGFIADNGNRVIESIFIN